MATKWRVIAGAGALAVALSAVAVAGAMQSHPAAQTVKIAYIGALTGDFKTIVLSGYQSAQLAVQLANSGKYGKLPVKIQLVPFDTQGSSDQATPVAQKVANDKSFIGVIGPAFSNETQAGGPILDQSGIPFMTPSATNIGLDQHRWKHWFRAVIADAFGAPIMASYLAKTVKPNCVFGASDGTAGSTSWLVSVTNSLAKFKVDVKPSVFYSSGQKDFSALVSKMSSYGCKVFFATGYSIDVGPIRKQLTDAGLTNVQIFGSDAFKDDQYVQLAGPSSEGTQVICDCTEVANAKDKLARAYVAAYKNKYGTAPGTYGPEAWDIAQMYIAGIKARNLTRASLTNFFHDLRGFKGVTKTYQFLANGELAPKSRVAYFYGVKGGKWVPLRPAIG
jgi:branched-chain amino acid transport system substrate-binding protein